MSLTAEVPRRSPGAAGAVAIVASAGGIPALIALLRALPANFPLPIFVTQHLARDGNSVLDQVLSWHSQLPVRWAIEAEQPFGGNVYLAPPAMRMRVSAAGFKLSRLPLPSASWLASADHLITSLVALYGSHTVGVALSGAMPAGVNGLRTIKMAGGYSLAQDRISAGYFDMPAAAIDFGKAEIVMPPAHLAVVLEIVAGWWRDEEEARCDDQALPGQRSG